MKNLLKFFIAVVILLSVIGGTNYASAEEHKVHVYFFWGEGCPHCAKEKMFLENLRDELGYVELHSYEVWRDEEGQQILFTLARESNLDYSAVPITIIGDQVSYGYGSEATTGEAIRHLVEICHINQCADQVGMIIAPNGGDGLETAIEAPQSDIDLESGEISEKIDVPFFGEIDISAFSLPALTFVIALIDGFNPCAMWALVFLISILLGVPSMRRRWILGLTFILASGIVYFLFLAAWLNIFLFIGTLFWVRMIVGILAVGAGVYYLYEFWSNKEGTCKISSSPSRRRMLEALRKVTMGDGIWIAIIGITLIAFAVNMIELICSAGLPAIYTHILSMSELPGWQYYLYLLFYILIFLMDDIIVFVIAMLTLHFTGLGTKYTRYASLVGGVIILLLGFLILFFPELLMFG